MSASGKAEALEEVAAKAAALKAAELALDGAVRASIDLGVTWSELGAALGVSRQAAFQRFGPKERRPRP